MVVFYLIISELPIGKLNGKMNLTVEKPGIYIIDTAIY